MPVANYDKWFGPSKGSAQKALNALVKQYGLQKGTRIFYGLLADRRKAGKTYARKPR